VRPPQQRSAGDPTNAHEDKGGAVSDEAARAVIEQLVAELDASRQEVAELRGLVALRTQMHEKLQARLEVSEEQRQSTTQRLSDLRLELELCHSAMVAPLRLETSKLRKQLNLKEQDLQIAVDALHSVALDNEILSSHLHEVQQRLEKKLQIS
jgi:chromosome segregation ATPase